MGDARLVVLRGATRQPPPAPGVRLLPFEELRRMILGGEAAKLLLRHREAQLLTYDLDLLTKPFNSALLLRLLSRGRCLLRDEGGRTREVNSAYLAGRALALLRDAWGKRSLLRGILRELRELESAPSRVPRLGTDPGARPLYLRTDLIFGLRAGGSVGHIAGVLNNLGAFAGRPLFFTTDPIPTVRADIETRVIRPDGRFADFAELPALHFSARFAGEAERLLAGRAASFVYQRYSLHSRAGLALARRLGVPLVLEYNGSEVWLNRNWGRPLRYEGLAGRIEMLNLRKADLVVVVSRPMRDELRDRGIDEGKVLVNPNGVDTERYSPASDGSAVRERYGLVGKTVVGFIGTFGRWHGAEVLAEAFGRLLDAHPGARGPVRLLMIGDGVMMPEVRERIARAGIGADAVLTGPVPQEEGPSHLAACDILVSPHVPNADGTPFFGSPTKLFEYMAMGKGIVASDLYQIGEVLAHGRTAWLVRPGDPAALADGIARLVENPGLARRLGEEARGEAVARHTWREHTRRIVQALRERCP